MLEVTDQNLINQIQNARAINEVGHGSIWARHVRLNDKDYIYVHYSPDGHSVKKEFYEITKDEAKHERFTELARERLREIS